MLRSLLVPVDGSECSEAATWLALDWARRFEARIVGLGVVDRSAVCRPEPVPLGAGAFKKHRDERRLAEAHHRVASVLAEFQHRATASGVAADMLEETGDPADCILREAQCCDIVVVGRKTHFALATRPDGDGMLNRLLRARARPLVVVPPTPRSGDHVLFAYGGGREAVRTLQIFAMLGLAEQTEVDVFTVHSDQAHARMIGHAAAHFLSARAIKHRIRSVVSTSAPADVILQEIAGSEPSLVVMGAHGHHPVRDLFATSVTRTVLEHSPVPVFIGA